MATQLVGEVFAMVGAKRVHGRRFEAFRRTADDQWMLHDMSDADTLEVACLSIRVAMAEVFAGM